MLVYLWGLILFPERNAIINDFASSSGLFLVCSLSTIKLWTFCLRGVRRKGLTFSGACALFHRAFLGEKSNCGNTTPVNLQRLHFQDTNSVWKLFSKINILVRCSFKDVRKSHSRCYFIPSDLGV